jgi:hypothetical protein
VGGTRGAYDSFGFAFRVTAFGVVVVRSGGGEFCGALLDQPGIVAIVPERPGTPEATANRQLRVSVPALSGLPSRGVWLGSVNDAVDRGATDAVFLGEIGEGHIALGVAAADGPRCRGRQLGLFAT